MNYAVPLAKNKFPRLVSNTASNAVLNAIHKFERRISEKGALRVGKGFTFSSSNEDMDDIIKMIKSLEDSRLLIDGVIEIVEQEVKNGKVDFWCFTCTFGCCSSANFEFFGGERYHRKRSHESRKKTKRWISSTNRITFIDKWH